MEEGSTSSPSPSDDEVRTLSSYLCGSCRTDKKNSSGTDDSSEKETGQTEGQTAGQKLV